MARSKRRPFRKSASRRKADWVYRGNVFDVAGGLIEDLGTYAPQTTTLTAGVGSAFGKVLYDSHNYIKSAQIAQTPNLAEFFMPSAARAEGSRAKILRVQGVIMARPTTWTIGSFIRIGFRFGFFEQDADSGVALVDPLYSMFNAAGLSDQQPARWANDRAWQHERRFLAAFATGNEMTTWTWRFNFPVNRSLRPDQGYFVYIETEGGSATLNVQRWLRTLVVDEG